MIALFSRVIALDIKKPKNPVELACINMARSRLLNLVPAINHNSSLGKYWKGIIYVFFCVFDPVYTDRFLGLR
jgi:hypothetical protein